MLMTARTCRVSQPCTPRTFKQLLACRTQHHPTLSTEQICDRAEIRKDRLYAYANEGQDAEIPFRALLKLAAAIDAWDLLDFALAQYGRRVIAVAPASATDIVAGVLHVGASTGQLQQTVSDALANDGRLDDAELAAIQLKVQHHRRDLDRLEAAARQAVMRR